MWSCMGLSYVCVMKLNNILFAFMAVAMFAGCEEPVTQKECGVIVFKNADGHGLAAAPTDLPYANWENAKLACEDLVLDGCDDWRLPTNEELIQLYANKDRIGGFAQFDFYWSSTLVGMDDAYTVEFDNGKTIADNKTTKNSVRAVRSF